MNMNMNMYEHVHSILTPHSMMHAFYRLCHSIHSLCRHNNALLNTFPFLNVNYSIIKHILRTVFLFVYQV